MSDSLLEKIKKSRESLVTVEGKTYTLTRPTPMQALDWLKDIGGNAVSAADINQFFADRFSLNNDVWRGIATDGIKKFVVGWDFNEIDLISGGNPYPVPFNREVFLTWIEDYPAIVTQLGYEIFSLYAGYLNKVDTNEGELDAG